MDPRRLKSNSNLCETEEQDPCRLQCAGLLEQSGFCLPFIPCKVNERKITAYHS